MEDSLMEDFLALRASHESGAPDVSYKFFATVLALREFDKHVAEFLSHPRNRIS